jgi:hypothetical protein
MEIVKNNSVLKNDSSVQPDLVFTSKSSGRQDFKDAKFYLTVLPYIAIFYVLILDFWQLRWIIFFRYSPFTILLPILLIIIIRQKRKNENTVWEFHNDKMISKRPDGRIKKEYLYSNIRNWDERKRLGTRSKAYGVEENYTELVFWMNDDSHDGFKETDYSNYAQMSGFFMERLFELGKSEIR